MFKMYHMENKTKSTKVGAQHRLLKSQLPQPELWQSFYALAQHWLSDLKFFEHELNFFRTLIDKNLSLLIDAKNIDKTRTMVSHLISLEKDREKLHQHVLKHAQHITLLVGNAFAQDAQKVKEEHAEIEVSVAEFLKTFRAIKSEVFKLTERVVHSEKAKRMVDWA